MKVKGKMCFSLLTGDLSSLRADVPEPRTLADIARRAQPDRMCVRGVPATPPSPEKGRHVRE